MIKIVTLLCSLIILFSGTAFANVPIIPVSELQQGMRGYAKTVIRGDTIETFDVEVLGVTGSEAGGYQILIKASGDLVERSGGIAQGMSGSPVYINGRLAGAVAFGKVFSDPRYCFLTPIESMFNLLDEPVKRYQGLIPKGTALMASGFSDSGFEYLGEKLQDYNLTLSNVGGTGGIQSQKPLEPGSAVGISVVTGDITVGALGTVTWTDDAGNVLAFGHPFMQRGNSKFFMNKAWVLASIPNYQTAYKVGNIGDVVGTFNQDRSAGVGGLVGAPPASVPLYVSVSDESRAVNGSLRVRVTDDEQLLPALVDSVVMNAVTKVMDRNGGGTAKVTFAIDALAGDDEQIKIYRENMYYAANGVARLITPELSETATTLMRNKFKDVNIQNINVNVDVDEQVRVAEIVRASIRKDVFERGQTVNFDVVLKPYREEEINVRVPYTIPQDAPGTLNLSIRGGASLNWIQELLRKQKEDDLPSAKKNDNQKTLVDFVKTINNADRNNEIIIDTAPKNEKRITAVAFREESDMPAPSLSSLSEGSKNKQKMTVDYIVDGEVSMTLKVGK